MTGTLYPFIDCIESLSKSPLLRDGDVLPFVRQVLIETSDTLECERVNVWMLEEHDTILANLLSFNNRTREFELQAPLFRDKFPNYFEHLLVNEIIVANDAISERKNKELIHAYIIPNNIHSMIDVPLRTDGEMFGVICYERLNPHNWGLDEQKFIQSVAQLLSLALETQKRKKLQEYLQELIDQKNVLLAEINHRTKNNNSVIISMINLMKHKAKDEEHKNLFEQLTNRVYSLAAVQNQLSSTDNFERVELSDYLNKLIVNLKGSFPHAETIETTINLETTMIPLKQATSIGLILNEAVTNVYKYAFDKTISSRKLLIELRKVKDQFRFVIADNGKGMDLTQLEDGLGFDLIKDLAENIDGNIVINSFPGEGCSIELTFVPTLE